MTLPSGFDGPRWLSSHVNLESINVPAGSRRGPPTLERIDALMRYLGSPESEFPAVHITGTNGKTTTVRVLTELLTTLGLKVGTVWVARSKVKLMLQDEVRRLEESE